MFLELLNIKSNIYLGIFGDEIDLPDNCWGENLVPQIKILPLVDLAIIHGGNNSLTESLYFGKPLIVVPVFADQNDNAQRVHEKGFGIRLDAFTLKKEQLENAIDKLANDENLKIKLENISRRIKKDNKSEKLVELIENLVK